LKIRREYFFYLFKYTFNLAKRVYGFDAVPVADAYKFLSKALTSNKCFKDNLYYEYAQRAFKIAIENYPSQSPKLIGYQISLGEPFMSIIFVVKDNNKQHCDIISNLSISSSVAKYKLWCDRNTKSKSQRCLQLMHTSFEIMCEHLWWE